MNFKFAEQITRGVEYLNERDPEWYNRVDLDEFDMGDERDVLRQTGIDGDDISQELGFYTPSDNDTLTKEWQQTIRSLRTQPSWDEVPPQATTIVQDDNGTWCPGNYQYAEPDSIGGWKGKPADSGHWFSESFVETGIPNPAWRATSYTRPEQNQEKGEATMNKADLYEQTQEQWIEENNVRVGDKVKILRTFEHHEMGVQNSCTREMHKLVGTTSRICAINGRRGITLENGFQWPWFVLEKVESAQRAFPIERIVGHEIEVREGGLKIGCQNLTFDTIDEFIERYNKWRSDSPTPIEGFGFQYLTIFGERVKPSELFDFIDTYKQWRTEQC